MFDTHCHLDKLFNSTDASLSISFPHLAVSTDSNCWSDLLQFSHSNSNVIPALGIHPWFTNKSQKSDLTLLDQLLKANSGCCIGEIGLDFMPQHRASREAQLFYFEQQLHLAVRHQRAVSLHIVKAHNEALSLLTAYQVKGSVHGLGASFQLVQRYLDLGYKIGINGVSVRENARRYHQMIKYCGIDNLVLETDYPNIVLPECSQSQLDDIFKVAEQLAILLNLSVATVIEITDNNAKQLFIE